MLFNTHNGLSANTEKESYGNLLLDHWIGAGITLMKLGSSNRAKDDEEEDEDGGATSKVN